MELCVQAKFLSRLYVGAVEQDKERDERCAHSALPSLAQRARGRHPAHAVQGAEQLEEVELCSQAEFPPRVFVGAVEQDKERNESCVDSTLPDFASSRRWDSARRRSSRCACLWAR